MPLRSVGALGLTVALVTAGCLGLAPTTDPANAENPTTVPRATYPEPPATVTNATATQTVIEYEAARLQNELRAEVELTYFEMGYMQPANATVLNRSDGDVYVKVTARYSYATPRKTADGVPVESLYFVNQTTIRHVAELD